ncbi:MAG: hypothetical protein KF812_07075 [Fimbriimonadaceae bacterium]|nr:hypothetical protein [Fimbriimonadaceae bacterium]
MITLIAALALVPEPTEVDLAGKWANQTVTAKVKQSPTTDGGLVVSVVMSIRAVNGGVKVTQETTYNPYGTPIRQLVVTDNGRTVNRVVASYTSTQVEWKRDNDTAKMVSIPDGTSIAAVHVFWFYRSRPQVGTRWTYARFNTDIGDWVTETVLYRGPEQIPSLGQMVNAHRIEEGESISWVDDKGKLLRLRRGDLLLERVEAQ